MKREEVVSKALRPEKCEWTQDVDGSWDTECGNKFCIEEGTPKDNEMLFCCYCGAALFVEAAQEVHAPGCDGGANCDCDCW